ncbi:MAG TPA: hypothetical protein DCZ94_00495 [Lentisphaeria bacterium]|nr:MAG: hypothetical protein A2X48_12055 [Lentisphaerae bacterium GWF2_49_21]HBC85410.1 hypothetical protein [Lentisphaeria bacterium]
MKKLKLKFPASDEKGIALLFTLGILSVLLVIALSFATTSITERKAAANNNDLTVARMLAESAVNRAIGAMKYYTLYAPGADYDNIISHYESVAADSAGDPVLNRETFDFLWRLDTVIDGTTIYQWPRTTYDKTKPGAVHWQYIDNGLTGNDKKLIGRISYVVVGSGGKLDPAACVNQAVAVDEGDTYGGNIGDVQDRDGKSVSEISIYNLDQDFSTYLPAATLTKCSYQPLVAAGTLTSEKWADWETLFAAGALNVTLNAQKTQFQKWFVLSNPKDPEAFWVDINNDNKDEAAELYHRFNLARTTAQWDSLDSAASGSVPPGNGNGSPVDEIIAVPTKYATAATHDGSGIKWLKNYTNLPVGTFTTAETRAKQIAANLIDYCDSTSSPTRDSDTDPTYTGNELTPYLNEIGVEVACAPKIETQVNGLGQTEHKNTYDFSIKMGAELINVYDGRGYNLSGATTIEILAGKIKYTLKRADGSTYNEETAIPAAATPITAVSSNSYLYEWYFPFVDSKDTGWFVTAVVNGASVTDVSTEITRVRLNYGGTFADFAKPDATGSSSEVIASLATHNSVGTMAPAKVCYFAYEANDPRQNLNDGDWIQAKKIEPGDSYGAAAKGSPNAVNNGISVVADGDQETVGSMTDPISLSTAYIRNAPMKSPWELGFIHRGAKWETLNIHEYNTATGVGDTAGIGAYTDTSGGTNPNGGDANILDQIKMSSDTQVYGKVSVQSASADVLKALFGYVRVGTVLPNNGTDGIAATADDNAPGTRNSGAGAILGWGTDVTTIASGVSAARSSSAFKTRAQMARAPELSNRASQTTKATRDEIIGKVVNLTKVSAADTLTIIALAQSIRDVGIVPSPFTGPGVQIKKDLNQDGDVSDSGIAGSTYNAGFLYDSDADGNDDDSSAPSLPTVNETIADCKLGQYDLGADEILSEQKIVVQVYRDTITHKWKILRFEYIDQ